MPFSVNQNETKQALSEIDKRLARALVDAYSPLAERVPVRWAYTAACAVISAIAVKLAVDWNGYGAIVLFVIGLGATIWFALWASRWELPETGSRVGVGILSAALPRYRSSSGSAFSIHPQPDGEGDPVIVPGSDEWMGDLSSRQEALASALVSLQPILRYTGPKEIGTAGDRGITLYDTESDLHETIVNLADCLDNCEGTQTIAQKVDWASAYDWAVSREELPRRVKLLDVEVTSNASATGEADEVIRLVEEVDATYKRLASHLEESAANREISLTEIVPSFEQTLLLNYMIASFSFYCPSCNAAWARQMSGGNGDDPNELVSAHPEASTRLVYFAEEDRWRCPACDEYTSRPITIHRTLDELILPTYRYLLRENRMKRIDVYSDQNLKRAEYTRDWERENDSAFTRNRTAKQEAEHRIRELLSKMAEAKAAVKSYRDLIGEIESLRESRLKETQDRYEQMSDRIAKSNKDFLSRHTAFIADIRSELASEIEGFAQQASIEREQEMQVLGQIASNTAQTAENTSRIADATEFTADVMGAYAHKDGLDRGKGILGIPRNIGLALDDAMSTFKGEPDLKQARRHRTQGLS